MKQTKILFIILCITLIFTGCVKTQEESSDYGIVVTDDTFESTVLSSEGVVLVDFWASWCAPCVSLAPTLEEVCTEADITLYKVNVDENPKLSSEYEISAIPAVYVFVDGEYKDVIIGGNGKSTYVNKINEYK